MPENLRGYFFLTHPVDVINVREIFLKKKRFYPKFKKAFVSVNKHVTLFYTCF